MRVVGRLTCLLLLASVFVLPRPLTAQEAPKAQTPGVAQTDQQKRGEALFLTRCPLCHVHSNQKRSLGIQASTELIGLFSNGGTSDETVRQRIVEGLPKLMPSFQYALDSKQIDDIIAYLKIR